MLRVVALVTVNINEGHIPQCSFILCLGPAVCPRTVGGFRKMESEAQLRNVLDKKRLKYGAPVGDLLSAAQPVQEHY